MKIKPCLIIIVISLLSLSPFFALADITAIRGLQGNVRQYEENGRVGLMDADFNVLHKAVFSYMGPFEQNGMASIWIGSRIGKIDRAGNICLQPQPYTVRRFEVTDNATGDGVFFISKRGSRLDGLMNMNGEVLCEPVYERIDHFKDDTVFVEKGKGQYNLMDAKGNLLCDTGFTNVDWSARLGTIEHANGKDVYNGAGKLVRRYIQDQSGKQMLVEAYTDAGELIVQNVEALVDMDGRGKYYVKRDGLWGVMDMQGEELIPCKYEWIDYTRFGEREGYFIRKNGLQGLMDMDQNQLIGAEWDNIRIFSEKTFLVEKDGRYGLVADDGKLLVPPEWDDLMWWQEPGEAAPFLLAQKNGEMDRYIDMEGNTVRQLGYSLSIKDGTGSSVSNVAYFLFYPTDQKGKVSSWIIVRGERMPGEQVYQYFTVLSHVDNRKLTLYGEAKSGFYKYIDGKGFVPIIRRGKENGFTKPTGEIITSPDWECVYPFNNYGTAFIRTKSEKYRLIDLNGAYLNGSEWDHALFGFSGENGFEDMGGYAVAKVGLRDAQGEMRFGYINHLGELIDRIE